MARELTSTQQTNVEAGATRPIYLVEWQHSGTTEYLSCSGTVQYGSGSPVQTYTAGGLTIAGIEDSKTATIVLPATADRITEILGNTWRGGICKITAILAAPGDTPLYSSADGLLMLDGLIEASTFSGETITVTAKCKYYTGALVPRFTFNDVTGIIPAVGSVSTWEGENYSYEQWLKTVAAIQRLVRPGVNPQVTGRPSTSQVNSLAPVEQTGYKLLTAEGVHIPIVYGRASVPGYIFADGEYSGDKFIGVAWCLGEVFSVEKVFINDAEVPSTVRAKHYRGTTTQTVSPALQLYTNTSPVFSDDMILHAPAGDVGICYSVFNIPASAISGAPRFRAIINGRIVEDPTSTALTPFDDYVGFSFNFLTGLTDSSPNAHTLTLNGGAAIASPSIGLQLDGTGDYATIADSATLELGSLPFTLEIEAATNTLPASPGTPETLICHGATSSPLRRSLRVDLLGNELLLYLSSDGSTWDIANGLSCGTVVGSPSSIFRLVVERVDNQISTYLDGATQLGVVTTAAIYNSSSNWELGACGGAQEWSGVIRSARLTVGAYRYGSPHPITNDPFSDSGTYTAGKIYSEKPALAWNDLAKDPVIGLAATTTGVQTAMEYGDSAMDSGAPRCRIGISISEPRLVESWLDQLAMYANCLWFPEGADLKIIPDKIKDGTNGSGRELYSAASPEVFGSPLPAITTEDGVSYSVSIEITTAATTSPITGLSVNLGGTEVIATQTAVGTHGGTITVSGTSNTIEVLEEAGFNGTWANLSVRRTHRLIDQWLPSTLSVTGMPEGDKPNAVLAKYTIPDDTTGAWKQTTFGVMNEAAEAGDPIVLTTLELPGVNRIEEASNKAIAKLQREDKKVRISLVSTDEEVVCQPGDTVQVLSTYRGIDAPVWVESSHMVTYGRFQITGTIYRDRQYPDTDYTDGGALYLEGYTPVVTVNTDPACLPYSCSAYIDYLEEMGTLEMERNKTWGRAYRTSGDAATLPWPFSINEGTDGKHIAYINYISSPTDLTIWDTSSPSSSQVTTDIFTETVTDATFCNGTLDKMGAISASSGSGLPFCIIPAAARLADQTDAWGDHHLEALIMGHNIGTAGDTISGTLIRGSSKPWKWTRNSVFYTEDDPDTLGVSATTSGSDVTIRLFINQGSTFSGPDIDTTFTVSGASLELHLFQAHIATGTPYEAVGDDGDYNVRRDVTITCYYAGGSATLTGVQWYNQRTATSKTISGLAPWTNISSPGRLYDYAQIFYNATLNLASFSAGGLPPESVTATQAASRIAWERNREAYEVPGYCLVL